MHPLPGRGPLLILALACAACPRPQDSAEPIDTGDGWPGLEDLGPEQLTPPISLDKARFLTVPTDRGLVWERDEDFLLDNFTVPHVVIRDDGTFMMMATNMEDPEGRWSLDSDDALSWTAAEQALFLPDEFPQDCGNRIEDGTVLYLEDGGYRLLLEGTELDEDTDLTDWRVWCQARSDDGHSWEATEGIFYAGGPADGDLPSVPTPFTLSNWDALIYYMGDLYGEVGGFGDGNGMRIASVDAGADHAEPWIEENILPEGQVDPMPVYLEGGGLRLYHTSTVPYGGGGGRAGPGPGLTETSDGQTFGEVTRLIDTDGHCFEPTGGECILDPFFLHLDDGTMVLYYTYLNVDNSGEFPDWLSVGIGRAFAVD